MKKTVVIGASPNPGRYAYLACQMLSDAGITFVPIGKKEGKMLEMNILDIHDKPQIAEVHTLTMYINAAHQIPWYDYFLSLNPQRIIFNPGAENAELASIAKKLGITVENSCSLVLLRSGQY